MADLYGRRKRIDEAVEGAEKGKKPPTDHCADARAKVQRQPKGSSRRKLAQQQLEACMAKYGM